MFTLFIISLVGSLIFYFMFFHFTLIFRGITQIEETFRFDQRYDDYYCFLQKLSKWEKFKIVFGWNPLFWLIPISSFLFINYLEIAEDGDMGYVFNNVNENKNFNINK